MFNNKPFYRKRKSGVTRIVRDSYGKPSNWFSLCKEVRQRDQYRCIACKLHHLISLSRGGTTTKANLGLFCKTCHDKRHKHLQGSR